MVLVDHTERGVAAELVHFLAPYMNGAPASDEPPTTGPAGALAGRAAKLADNASDAPAVLRELTAALGKHASDIPEEEMLHAYTLMWDVISANAPADASNLARDLAKQLVADLAAKPADRPASRLAAYARALRLQLRRRGRTRAAQGGRRMCAVACVRASPGRVGHSARHRAGLCAPPLVRATLSHRLARPPAVCVCRARGSRPRSIVALYDRVGKANPAWRYELLLVLIKFAGESRQLRALPSPAEVERWLAHWGSDKAERIAVYDAACACSAACGAGDDETQAWLLLLLRECDGGDAKLLGAHAKQALAAVGGALRSPSFHQYDTLAELDVVKHLAQSAEHKGAFELLRIFTEGGVPEYTAFAQKQPKVLEQLGLEPARALGKMRLLSLVTLGHAVMATASRETSFEKAAEATGVGADEVELLVLDAISAGLLEARIDELHRTIRVTRAMHRTFGPAQWKALGRELGEWRTHVQALLEVIGTAPVAV